MENQNLTLSSLRHTWIIDLDGTILKHNGYKIDGFDSFLPQSRSFLSSIPSTDMIIILTSRTNECKEQTLEFLERSGVRYDYIIFNVPYGERILLNDDKPSGLKMSFAVSFKRDKFNLSNCIIDENL